jgi:hypothetical protein
VIFTSIPVQLLYPNEIDFYNTLLDFDLQFKTPFLLPVEPIEQILKINWDKFDMSIRAQLLPHKHIRFSESLIGLAGFVRQLLKEPHSIDELWEILNRDKSDWLYKPTFDQVVIAIVVLFALDQLVEVELGRLQVKNYETH